MKNLLKQAIIPLIFLQGQIYSGKAPEFEEGDIFRTTIYTTNESEEENSKPEVADKVADKLNETQLVILFPLLWKEWN